MVSNPEAGRAAGKHNDADSSNRLLNETEAAAFLGLKVATLRRWRWSGDGCRFIKLGSAVRYAPADLAAFVAAGVRRSTTDGREAA